MASFFSILRALPQILSLIKSIAGFIRSVKKAYDEKQSAQAKKDLNEAKTESEQEDAFRKYVDRT
jgi:Sec-independent protein translocase protein TatA